MNIKVKHQKIYDPYLKNLLEENIKKEELKEHVIDLVENQSDVSSVWVNENMVWNDDENWLVDFDLFVDYL